MSEHHRYPEEVKAEAIQRIVAKSEFYCPKCGARLRLRAGRKPVCNDTAYYSFQPCGVCGYQSPAGKYTP